LDVLLDSGSRYFSNEGEKEMNGKNEENRDEGSKTRREEETCKHVLLHSNIEGQQEVASINRRNDAGAVVIYHGSCYP
jgi:hypothetical protein